MIKLNEPLIENTMLMHLRHVFLVYFSTGCWLCLPIRDSKTVDSTEFYRKFYVDQKQMLRIP